MVKNKKKHVVTVILSLIIGLGTVMSVEAASKETEYNEAMQLINQYVEEQFASLSSDEKQQLVEEIYVEKYIVPQCNALFIEDEKEDEKEDEFTDIAYQNTLLRQNYVVDLISSHSGKKTSLDDWEYNLEYLENHYEEIMKIDNVNKVYIDLYIEEYTVEKERGVMPDKRINVERTKPTPYSITTYATTTYSATDAAAYAKKYYTNYNSKYPDWTNYGGDCANFISQCLYAGGKKMKGRPGTDLAAQNWSNWFSSGSSCNTKNVSSTWRGANAFKSYWQDNASSYQKFQSVGSASYYYGYIGDAVSLLKSDGTAYHTLMIVGYDASNNDFIVAAHTGNTITRKLSSYPMSGGFIIYNMR